MGYKTIKQYFDIETGEEIEKTQSKKRLEQKIKQEYEQIRKHRNFSFNGYNGITTIEIIVECRRTKQLKLF